jgi:hypothetical protein
METPTQTAPPVDLDRLVRLVESAIRSQDGKMILDIHVDDELRDAIRGTLQENIEWRNGEKHAIESALRNVFAAHETHMTQAATDDANMGLRRAMDFLPNAEVSRGD